MTTFTHLNELLTALEDDQTVKILVTKGGGIKKTYHVSRGILKDASPWFANAVASNKFMEGQFGVLRFPDTEPEVVEQVIFYLVRGCLPQAVFSDEHFDAYLTKVDAIDRKLFREIEANQLTDVKLWTFAEEHMLPELQQLAMKRLYGLLKTQYPSLTTIRDAYLTSPEGSMLRKVMMFEIVAGFRNKYGEGKEMLPGYTSKDLEALSKELDGFMADFSRVAGKFMPQMKEAEGAAAFGLDAFLTGTWDGDVSRKISWVFDGPSC